MKLNPLLVIPARLLSYRLPKKVLADIQGKPMVQHVYERCLASGCGPVLIACDGAEIAEIVGKFGGQTVLTDPALPSGSDRVYAGVSTIDPEQEYNIIVNIQCDQPTIDPDLIRLTIQALENPEVDIATAATPIKSLVEAENPNVVKVVCTEFSDNPLFKRALYFSRHAIPFGNGVKYHHVGIYAYKRLALERYVKLPPSPLENSESLEQLRALEDGMNIAVTICDTLPLSVDTAEDLEKARQYFNIH